MMTRLFREEVLRSREAQYLGSIRIGRHPSFTLVALVSIVLAACLALYAAFGEVTRKTRLPGLLVPLQGTIAVSAQQAGTLVDVRVREGQEVAAQQPLMVVRIDRSTTGGDASVLIAQNMQQRRATLINERSLAQTQNRQREQALIDRARSLDTEARQAESEIVALRSRVELARRSSERYAELGRSGFVSQIQVQQKEEEVMDVTARLGASERTLIGVRRDAQSIRAEQIANNGALQTQLSQLDRSIAALEQEGTENSARRELVVVAPEAGTVTAVNAQRGQQVQPGQTLVAVIPRAADGKPSPLQAQLFAPSRSAGFVEPGQVVWLRYAAYPYQKFGMARGTIESVSRTPVTVQDLLPGQGQAIAAAAQSSEPLYRIVVALDSQAMTTYGQTQPLKAGMTLDADAVQDRRRVWEWVLEPVLAVSGIGQALASPPR